MKKFGRLTALFCAGVITVCSLVGCGGDAGGITDAENGKKNENADGADAEKSMGRYLEQEITVPDISDQPDYYPAPYLGRRDDGKLVLADKNLGIYISEDNGESWEAVGCPWSELLEDQYISDIALSPDGAMALVCDVYSEEEVEEESAGSGAESAEEGKEDKGENTAEEGTKEKEESTGEEETKESEGAEEEESGEIQLEESRYYYVDPEGTITEIPFQGSEYEAVIEFDFDRQGRLYGYGFNSRAYRIDPKAGTAKELFETDGLVDSACFTERYMVAFTTRNEVILYDLEKEMPVEDDRILQDFVAENLGSARKGADWGHDIIAASGEKEDIVYLAFRGGLYRYVIGGTVMEQIIDGGVTTFGDPSAELVAMEMLPDNEFIVLYTGRRFCRYTYDPDVPAVPEYQLNVYSLEENDSLRQAASLFQKEHQDVYVRYEIGMAGSDAVTREDAIRKLNTEILAGEGPDIMLLDGLPQASYEEKGVLADVSGIVEDMTGEEALFPNIVEACREDGKIYALPIRIQLPVAAGKAEYVEKIEDLESLADVVEEMREETPEGPVLGMNSAAELLEVLSIASSRTWTDETGAVDERALTEFLTAAKRIWEAEISGLDEEFSEDDTRYGGGISRDAGEEYATVSKHAVSIAMEEQLLALGKMYGVDFDYDVLTSVAGQEEDFGFRFWNGQTENGFIPDGMAAVLANSAEEELALTFYRFLFGRELQDMDLTGGLPVNMASFDTFAVNPYVDPQGFMEENAAGALVVVDDSGRTYRVDLLWPSEEDFGKLREMVSSVSVVNAGDATVKETVCEVGQKVLADDMTPEEAAREIVKRSAIYLAE